MQKDNLKAGMVLETRCGIKFLLMPYSGMTNTLYAYDMTNYKDRVSLDVWSDSLIHKFLDTMDIVNIFAIDNFREYLASGSINLGLVWSRPSREELEQYLGSLVQELKGILDLY